MTSPADLATALRFEFRKIVREEIAREREQA